ncbi:protein FAR1-RELATED SEQUENCE 6-like isoform X1 [Papaver somniferum]|uniref:protein FAR1-RELATED SEQUENCE 6-like isoform X1 n=1 Tax=Papaver somniferum TaxID=3469 RepID=UPI000E6F79E3|nr:protein FAR1-RELATED SEQUENCE 6-like isoform X1 [Papaver somniferum]XP_026386412.1 protein FAR1-RELATED SEQUENCE 6-like isoform X1 [Papaver somniferum]XP_026386413.1 protein FAR1-RELATED SEQUENCE 6-like isoform X1 [Papaver somniferum]XP_026386414.1 protein FAR1-RELATED SEQUENCE 6-like isoform X1 [Papaver somniferum]XP_026386415.1 protein FAR1-RELATED SEQUENCE 6-like isoform X1 [Papaver somniferum]XP_026386416.1 protein FAR1-RELATED SEQUENCE 6-like isoform X1 [Papaver somniferum]
MEETSSGNPSLEIVVSQENDGNEAIIDENDSTKKNKEAEIDNVGNKELEEPKVGMLFGTADEVLEYYKNYAKQLGFPVKKRSSTKDDDGVLRYVTLACARSGTSRSNSASKGLRPPQSIKTNCKALLSACISLDGRWRVSSVRLVHNHELSPDKVCFFRCKRVLNSHGKRKLDLNDKVGVKKDKNSSSLVEVGGSENTSILLGKDGRNYSEKASQLQLEEGDATLILDYLMKMKSQDANFFYAIDLDKQGRLRNVFWADARSRSSYEEFGDVIKFDTTYLANRYVIPFTPFVGVNHHGQPILFGCALVSSEDTETFIWLFQTWLACMSGRAPSGIITILDRAMETAIENVFPNIQHRWCLLHIMKILPVKLKEYSDSESIMLALKCVVYDSVSQSEFEEQWNIMIENYKLHNDDFLTGLYNERCRWVPVFVKENFWGGISPIYRNESMRSFFDDHVKSKTSFKQFVKRYEDALRSNVEKEIHEDFKCFSSSVNCVTHYDMEKQAQAVYTISKFKEFQNELTGKMYCDLATFEVDGTSLEYRISEDIMIGEKKKSVTFKVRFQEHDNEIVCSCSKFEFTGILCRHAIYVFIRHKVHLFPNKYIMQRWRKDVKRCHTKVKLKYSDWDTTPEAQRCDKMEKSFNEIKEMANDSEDKCVIVMSWMNKLKEELINHDYKSIRVTPKLPIPRILGNNVKSIPKEGQSMLSPNYLYGSNGTGNVALPIPIIYDNRFQGHHHQAWNGVYSMFSLPSSNLQGLGNQKPD